MCGCSAAKRVQLHICAVERVVQHRIGSHFNNYKDPHTISAVLAVFCACSATELAVDLALGARDRESGADSRDARGRRARRTEGGRATHALLRSSASRTSGSLVAAVALVRSALAGFSERAVCLHNAAEKVARRRSTSRAELHHLRAVPDDEGQGRR